MSSKLTPQRVTDTGLSTARLDAGLFALRIGAGVSFVLLFGLKQSQGASVFIYHPGRIWPLLALSFGALFVAIGFRTRLPAGAMALAWGWAVYSGLRGGAEWFALPTRAFLYFILFAALVLTGPGRFSLDHLLRPISAMPPSST
jgi:uncharacterized membrane protein YphA (DoxX/SURF4 family)